MTQASVNRFGWDCYVKRRIRWGRFGLYLVLLLALAHIPQSDAVERYASPETLVAMSLLHTAQPEFSAHITPKIIQPHGFADRLLAKTPLPAEFVLQHASQATPSWHGLIPRMPVGWRP
jgi:hypothetical protein